MIYLHIGSQKTGSSTVQHYLRANVEAFDAAGYRFVRAIREWSDHNKVARELRGGSPTFPRLDAVMAEIRSQDSPHFIISSEEMFHRRAIRRLAQHMPRDLLDQMHVIAYIRRPDDLMEALYKQRLKSAQIEPGAARFLEASWFECDYRAVLDSYAEVFGRQRMTVRPYRRDLLVNSDIIDDFTDALGVPGLAGLPRAMPEDNPSFSAALTQLMSLYVRAGAADFVKLNEIIAASDAPRTRRSGDVFTLEERAEIFDRIEPDIDYILDTYGQNLAPVLKRPDLAAQGGKGYPDADEWAQLHRAAGEAMVLALAQIQQARG